ncbi:MAG: hypothetical protein FWE91_02765 [Defluviitaleaceae bacterium]|nr:hypothetical protein [Defluviitaleaceae bacterium]MCL2835550.1 hypothetical protein [Defluviitaleaceae bacterium]
MLSAVRTLLDPGVGTSSLVDIRVRESAPIRSSTKRVLSLVAPVIEPLRECLTNVPSLTVVAVRLMGESTPATITSARSIASFFFMSFLLV